MARAGDIICHKFFEVMLSSLSPDNSAAKEETCRGYARLAYSQNRLFAAGVRLAHNLE